MRSSSGWGTQSTRGCWDHTNWCAPTRSSTNLGCAQWAFRASVVLDHSRAHICDRGSKCRSFLGPLAVWVWWFGPCVGIPWCGRGAPSSAQSSSPTVGRRGSPHTVWIWFAATMAQDASGQSWRGCRRSWGHASSWAAATSLAVCWSGGSLIKFVVGRSIPQGVVSASIARTLDFV